MYQTREKVSNKFPIPRKGTAYVAKALSNPHNSVPVVIAVRDMLGLAKTAKEVKLMIKQSLLKINGRNVKDYRESISLFNILHADKDYVLSLLPTGKFFFEETKNKDRICKVIGKKLINAGKVQLNFHDGTNLISKDKINVGDSVFLDSENKIKSHISLQKGKKAFITEGKYIGHEGKIENIEGKLVLIKFKDKEAALDLSQIIVI